MKKLLSLFWLILQLSSCDLQEATTNELLPTDGPIQLHPKNPHYFLYQGKTLALITSAEHYGAVLNLDFDYQQYLATLAADGMNYTRIFTGTYFENPGDYGIEYNTLAPKKDRVITPWLSSVDESGGVKYDMATWNQAYFKRLRDFVSLAAAHDIVVEVTLFSSIYQDSNWAISPQNPANNINLTEDIIRLDAQTLNNGPLLGYQESFVQKMTRELNEFDNLFFEIQNEPWADHPVAVYNIVNKHELKVDDWTYKADFASESALAWQERMAAVIEETEEELSKKHLIAQNYTNYRASIPAVSDRISIINFHYAWPDAVAWNYHYNKVIGFDESGFAGTDDQVYRRQVWQFMLSGGGLFNGLDYSFFVGQEDGLGQNKAPGGGGKVLRQQLKVLHDFLHDFSLEKMTPDYTVVKSAPGLIPYVLSDEEGTYAIYLRATGTEESQLVLKTGNGRFRVEVLNTISGNYAEPVVVETEVGILRLDIAIPDGELALKIRRE